LVLYSPFYGAHLLRLFPAKQFPIRLAWIFLRRELGVPTQRFRRRCLARRAHRSHADHPRGQVGGWRWVHCGGVWRHHDHARIAQRAGSERHRCRWGRPDQGAFL